MGNTRIPRAQIPDPRPLSCFSARPKPYWVLGTRGRSQHLRRILSAPYSNGKLSGLPSKSLQPPCESRQPLPTFSPIIFPTPAHGPVIFSRLDPSWQIGWRQSMAKEQEEGGAHVSAAPSPPDRPAGEGQDGPRQLSEPLPSVLKFLLADGLGGSS